MKAFNKYKKTTTKDRKCVKVHRAMVEKILGKPIREDAPIHHIDYDRSNNSNTNLVVCDSKSYHKLLHRRTDTLLAGYNPDTHSKCTDCNQYKENNSFSKNKTRATGLNNNCKECCSIRAKERYKNYVSID